MDRYKTNKPNRQPVSVDGMLRGGPRRQVAEKNRASMNMPNNPQRPRRLDDFGGSEGYRSQRTQSVSSDGSFEQQLANSNKNTKSYEVNSSIDLGAGGRQSKHKPKKSKKRSGWKVFKKLSIFTIIGILSFSGFMIGKAWWETQKALQGGGSALALSKDIDPYSLNGEGDGRVNILLLGKGGDTHEGGQLTDTIMVASLDPINNGVALLSIPRDLWVKPDDLWPMKINAVYNSAKEQYAYQNPGNDDAAQDAGIAAIEEVVEDYMGIKVNYYGMADFKAFEEAVNVLGGITVNMPEPYYDPTMLIGGEYLKLEAGPNQLDGGHALGLARSRYGAERGDFDRGRNQQLVMVAIKDKALSAGTLVNPLKINQLLNTFSRNVDTNFSVDDLMRLYDLANDIPNDSITSVDLALEDEAVLTTGNIGGQSVVYPVAGIDDYSEVQKYVRLKLKDSFIIKEDPSIIVLNASGKAGAATKRAEELKSYGYNVVQVADASKTDLEFTQLVDNNDGEKKYTKRYLELRFNTEAVSGVDNFDLSPYIADYIVLIGKNG